MKKLILMLVFWFIPAVVEAASGIVYVDTGGATTNSGTTDNNTAIVSASGVAVTCGATTYGGASAGCQLPAGTDLSGVAADGSQAIYLSCMTNANRKIAWITAVDDGNDQVQTLGLTVTGCAGAGTEQFAVGGRLVWTPGNVEAAMRAGDIIQFNNSPASSGSTLFTARTSGDGATGFITMRGKTGVRPVLTHTSTSNVITSNSQTGWYIYNLELVQQGASGNAISPGSQWILDNIKISASGGAAILALTGSTVMRSEITGTTGDAYNGGSITASFLYNYIHDVGGNCLQVTGSASSITIIGNIFDTCAGRGIYFTGVAVASPPANYIIGNVIYGNGNSGLEVTDADQNLIIFNNIFMDNGNAANEYNVEWLAGTGQNITIHEYNVFYHSNCQGSGTGGPSCVNNFTLNSTELSSNPSFTDAANGNFALSAASPALATGFPGTLLGGTNVGYTDIGALQRQAPASSGTGNIRPGVQ